MRTRAFHAVVAAGALAAACGGKEPTGAKHPEPTLTETRTDSKLSGPLTPTGPLAPTTPLPTVQPGPGDDAIASNHNTVPVPLATRPSLTDQQIAAITDASNNAEVDKALIAQKKATSPRVKKFATMMAVHHTKALKDQVTLLRKLMLTPEDNEESTTLMKEARAAVEMLEATEAADFDRVYIDGQVEAHQKVLEALDKDLIPNAQNADFKTSLQEFRPMVQAHLGEAREIQAALAAGAAATSAN